MQTAQILILACGVAALIYGLITGRQVLAQDPGNARMQEIAAAVQACSAGHDEEARGMVLASRKRHGYPTAL